MAATKQLGIRVRRVLAAALPHGVRVDVTPLQKVSGPALDVTVWAGATKHRFTAGWAGEGWPSDVEQLTHLVAGVEVVVARNLSVGARKWLSQEGLGWVDEAGHVEIIRPSGLVISREPTRAQTRRERPIRWSRSALAVAEAALSGVAPTVESIERATGLSRNATATALSRLERLGLLERPQAPRGPMSGRRIVDTNAFLDAYAKAAAEQRSKQSPVLVHRLWQGDVLDALRTQIAPALTAADARWAITGAAASLLLAPYLSDVTTLDLYVDAELMSDKAALAARLGGRIVEKGQRIDIRELPTSMSAKGPVIEGVQVALPVRVYADLIAAAGRSAEAAHHLRETLDVGTAA
jgi:Transcriptional regulator, AbiEi antitoxin, Type IV TA system